MKLFSEAESDLQERATALIKPLIPPDAEDRVVRATKQFGLIVREHIRTETGLRLSDDKGRGSVPVEIVDGFPVGVSFGNAATKPRFGAGPITRTIAVHYLWPRNPTRQRQYTYNLWCSRNGKTDCDRKCL